MVQAFSYGGSHTGSLYEFMSSVAYSKIDILSIHVYAWTDFPTPESYLPDLMTTVQGWMTTFGSKPIWFTEFGWSSHVNTGSEANWEIGVSEETQGDYLRRSFQMVKADYPYVEAMFWYNEVNTTNSTVQNDNYGLMYADGSPKPAYSAYQAWNASQDR